MNKIAFVILHYIALEDTIECVESILQNIKYDNLSIVLVDNNSPNSSGVELKEKYQDHPRVNVILNDKNLGFAKGNNVGYKYAAEELEADYIILLNNDTIIEDENFAAKILNIFDETGYAVLGPDIISLKSGQHQNPMRMYGMSMNRVKIKIKEMRRWYIKILIEEMVKNPKIINSIQTFKNVLKTLRNKYRGDSIDPQNNSNPQNNSIDFGKRHENVPLHGACLIFSPIYINTFKEGLYPETFMYMEEEILYYLCRKNNLTLIYDPSSIVYHKEDVSTDLVLTSNNKKNKFYIVNTIKSAKILYKLMKKQA